MLILQDDTALTYSDHLAVADQLGSVNDSATARGFIQHNTIAVDPERCELLGLIHQHTFCREPKPEGETRSQRYRRARRESDNWLTPVTSLGRMPDDACWVHIGDRAADFFGLMATARSTNSHFLLRLVQERVARVVVEDSTLDRGEPEWNTYLMEQARQVVATTTKEVRIGSRGGRPARVATVALGSVRLKVRRPHGEARWRFETPMEVTVVRVWEPDAPAGVEPLEWILGTDFADQSAEALLKYCSWYEWRWPTMEEYHKVQKTGLGIEKIRFETKERLLAAIALLSVVAVRVLGLRWVLDSHPDDPAKSVASAVELSVLEALETTTVKRIRTVREFVVAVARLGGYLGRTNDGPPGWGSIWRGYQRLADLVQGVELAESIRPPKRPRPKNMGKR